MMLKRIQVMFVLLGLVLGALLQTQAQDVYQGWAFYSSGNNCYLYDVDKSLVHTWTSDYRAAGAAHLMRDSSVLFSAFNPDPGWSGGVLLGGRFQIITWDGEVVWDFNYSSPEYCPHHNFEIMYYTDAQDEVPHVMAACYEKVSGTSRLPDMLVEIKPTGKTTAEIVWEWHAWDHRTNDPDNHPELIEAPSERQMGDWNHVNNVSYNRDLDQLVVDMKSFDEFIIIDHSTTTAEAASHSGGDYGMGGDLLYRWGQASNYGISGSDYIVGFHGGKWVPYVFPGTNLDVPGAGNVLIYHNDRDEIVEVELPGDGDGVYPRDPGEAWGPSSPTWTHDINASSHEGSVMRLPNGNTFICDAGGPMYEVTPSGQEVWTLDKGGNMGRKYAYSYLEPQTYIKKGIVSEQQTLAVNLYSNPVTRNIHISFNNYKSNLKVDIFSINGKKVLSRIINDNAFVWDVRNQSCGVYVVKIVSNKNKIRKIIHIVK